MVRSDGLVLVVEGGNMCSDVMARVVQAVEIW